MLLQRPFEPITTSASGIELSADTLAAIDDCALGDAPVKQPRLASFAVEGVTHR